MLSHQSIQQVNLFLIIVAVLSWLIAAISYVGMRRSIKLSMDNNSLFQKRSLLFLTRPEIFTDKGLAHRQRYMWSLVTFTIVWLLLFVGSSVLSFLML